MNNPANRPKNELIDESNSQQSGAWPVDGHGPERREAALWALFADISQSLQVSSASIKAAISSLLDTDIIWDRSAQFEFMQNIDRSIDRVSVLMAVMTLAMKAESGQLELALEPCNVQEIIARVIDTLEKKQTETSFALTLPGSGRPAYVDYDYLRIALKILLEALMNSGQRSPDTISIRAEETSTHWQLHITGAFSGPAVDLLVWLDSPTTHPLPSPRRLQSEMTLKAFTAHRLLEQQHITMQSAIEPSPTPSLTLTIPYAGEQWTSAKYS